MIYDSVILGSGPGGISAYIELVENGIESNKILILEKSKEHNFSVKKYYPEGKLVTANYKGFESKSTGTLSFNDCSKEEFIKMMDDFIDKWSINISYNDAVFEINKLDELNIFEIKAEKKIYFSKSVIIGIGILGKPNKPDYKIPSSLTNKVFFEITSQEMINSNVLVVGGGDSASEYVQFLLKKGNTVDLSYRSSEFKRMNKFNLKDTTDAILENKVNPLLSSNILSVEDDNGKVKVNFVEEKYATKEYDYVIFALGGTTPKNFLKQIGIDCENGQPILLDNFETSLNGLFITGDLSAGPKGGSIIRAFNISKKVADEVYTKITKNNPVNVT